MNASIYVWWKDLLKKEKKEIPMLMGISFAIKDNILVKGETASSASKILENYKAVYARVNADAESANEYNQRKVKIIFCDMITATNMSENFIFRSEFFRICFFEAIKVF